MIILVLVLLGLALGSFVNALVWRVHKQLSSKKALNRGYSIVTGRSMCPKCKHTLSSIDLIPVLSFALLRGKCRYCKKPIEDTPIPEITLPALFVLSYAAWPYGFDFAGKVQFGLWVLMLVGLLALVIYDVRWYLLPNRVVFPLIVIVIAQILLLAMLKDDTKSLLFGSLWGFLTGGGIFWLIYQVSGGKWIGGGDVKLGWMLGLLLGGPSASLLMIFLASVLGSVVAIPLLATGKATRTTRLPFGPFLIASSIIVYLFGSTLIAQYKRLYGL